MSPKLQDKVAIVTGAGRGIGRAIAIAFAREGARVALASRTAATVEAVAEEIRAEGGTAIAIPVDVGQKSQIFAVVETAASEFGPIDILVNNAQGFGTQAKPRSSTVTTPLEEVDDAEIEYTFRTGAMATLWGMQAVFAHMKARGGRIINFGSPAGVAGSPGTAPYNVTKEAVRTLTRTAANEWGVHNILVNTVLPVLRTDAFDAWEKAWPEAAKAQLASSPLRRVGDPLEDGGPLCVFLASEANSYMTGMTFQLNGGRIMS